MTRLRTILALGLLIVTLCACSERRDAEATLRSTAALGIQVSAELDVERYPQVLPVPWASPSILACGSQRCIVFYRYDDMVYASRVDSAGQPLDPHPVLIGKGWPLSAAARGDAFILIWGEHLDQHATQLRGSDGQVVADHTSRLPASKYQPGHAVFTNGTSWLLVSYADETRAVVKEIDTFETVSTPVVVPIGARVVAGEGQYLVVAHTAAQRISEATGAFLDPAPIEFMKYGPIDATPAGAYENGVYLMTWPGDGTVYGSRIRASDGARLDPDDDANQVSGAKVIASGQAGTNITHATSLGDTVLVSWGTVPSLAGRRGARVDVTTGNRVAGDPTSHEVTLPGEFYGPLLYNGSFGMTLETGRVLPFTVQHAPFAVVAENPKPATLATEPRIAPAVAWNGSMFFVAWVQSPLVGSADRIMGTRVGTNGAYLDDPPLDLGPGQVVLLAARGSDFFVVSYGDGASIQSRFVSASGQVGRPLADIPFAAGPLRLAYDGRHFLLVGMLANNSLQALRLDAAGAVVDPAPVQLPSNFGSKFEVFADATSPANARRFVVLHQVEDGVQASLLRSETGEVIGPPVDLLPGELMTSATDGARAFLIAGRRHEVPVTYRGGLLNLSTGRLEGPSRVFDDVPEGSLLEPTWYDGKSYLRALSTFLGNNRFDDSLRRYSPSLATLDEEPTLLPDLETGFYRPVAASDGAGRSLLVYVETDRVRMGRTVKLRLIVNDVPSDAGTDAADGSDANDADDANDAGDPNDAGDAGDAGDASDEGVNTGGAAGANGVAGSGAAAARAGVGGSHVVDAAADAGSRDAGGPNLNPVSEGGCGCRTSSPAPIGALGLVMLGAVATIARRRGPVQKSASGPEEKSGSPKLSVGTPM